MRRIVMMVAAIAGLVLAVVGHTAPPQQNADGVTVVHLDEFNGYFAAKETLGGLKAGTYDFVVTNRSDKLVGFQIQNFASHETLDKFPL